MIRHKRFLTYLIPVLVVLIALLSRQPWSTVVAAPSAAAEVHRAWEKARRIGVYDYTTSIAQITWPLPLLENVGLTATEERIYVEGQTNLPARTMRLRLWADGGDVQTGQESIEVRVADGKAFGRVGAGEWEEIDDFTDVFAPGNDALGYLAAARHIRPLGGGESPSGIRYSRFAFDVDGPAFAEYMRAQMEEELQRSGKLPPGMSIESSRLYADTTGAGEIWLDDDGLPLRQIVNLRFPPDRREQVEVTVETDFSGWGESDRPAHTTPFLPGGRGVTRQEVTQASLQIGLLVSFLGLIFLTVVFRRSRKLYLALVSFIITSTIVTPLLQAHQAHAFSVEQNVRREEYEQQQANDSVVRQMRRMLTGPDFDPHTPLASQRLSESASGRVSESASGRVSESASGRVGESASGRVGEWTTSPARFSPLALAAPVEEDDGTDTDGDGLTDRQELDLYGTFPNNADSDGDGLKDGVEIIELGTDPLDVDTDGDRISDKLEVVGFQYHGQQWYLNPRDADTNDDGQTETLECSNLVNVEWQNEQDVLVASVGDRCEDTDGDGTPDVFDSDDDGDGVPDAADLSRTTAMGGERDGDGHITGLAERTFHFSLDEMAVEQPIFVDFQFRPANPDHLWYTLNVLDWPSGDKEGQIHRVFDTTFKDANDAHDPPLESGAKDANGDMRLVPMLEIEIPFNSQNPSGGLPVIPDAPAIEPTTPITAWLDVDKVADLRISVRKKDDTGTLLAYVPVSLVRDDTGDGPVAFSARMFYQPAGAAFGDAQQVRLVWLVQALTDLCTAAPDGISRDEWCDDQSHWVQNPPRVLHVYYDDWYLTGLAVREDHGLKVGVAFENPTYADREPNYEQYLWALAHNLDRTFIAGRRDVDIAAIERRFDITTTATAADRWDIPAGALVVETYPTFPDQSYIAALPMTHTRRLLEQYFPNGRDGFGAVVSPTLLFLREEFYRSANLEMDDILDTQGVNREAGLFPGNQLTLALDPNHVKDEVLAGMNWAPYRFDAGGWETYPIEEYWDWIKTRYPDIFEDVEGDPEGYIKAGQAIVAQGFYLGLYHGVNAIVQIGDDPILSGVATSDEELQLITGDWLKFKKVPLGIVGDAIEGALEELPEAALRVWLSDPAAGIRVLWGGSILTTKQKFFAAIGGAVKGVKGSWTKLFQIDWDWGRKAGIDAGLTAVGVITAVAGVMAFVGAGVALGLEGEEIVFQVLDGINFVMQVKSVVSSIRALGENGWSLRAVTQTIKSHTVQLRSAATIAAIVGLVISIAVDVGFFVAQMISAGVEFGSLAFNQAFAALAASIIVAVIFTALSMTLVGAVIVAIIGLIDSVISLICKLTGLDDREDLTAPVVGLHPCQGISGALAKLIQFLIYSQNPLVDLEREERLEVMNFNVDLEDQYPNIGYVAGNKFKLSASVTTKLYMHWPVSPLAYTYAWQYSEENLKESSFRYSFSTAEVDLHTLYDLSTERPSTWNDADPPARTTNIASGYVFSFDQTGINQGVGTAYLNEGHAVNAQECFVVPNPIIPYTPPLIPVCYLRDKSDTLHVDVGQNLKFDIFPATLDGFYELTSKDGGYALAWGQEGDLTFPVLADADGDGLRSLAFGGNDPSDRTPDTDFDGLSDFFEVRHGFDPTDADMDDDGLSDYEEVRHETLPDRPDTDNDGLWDGQEVAGWDFTYDFDGDTPLVTHVTSDPLNPDTDGDGLLDKLEYVYGFNPRVPGPVDVLQISSTISDADGIVKPGDTIAYTATIENELKLRYALGLLEVEFPAAVQDVNLEPQPYFLAPRQKETLIGSVTVRPDIAASQHISLTNTAGAIIADLLAQADGRELWLHLDESETGAGFEDDSLNGHTGVCSGDQCPTAGAEGYAGRALQFAGNDVVTVYPFAVPEINQNYTLALWFKTSCADCGLSSVNQFIPMGFGVTQGFDRALYLESGHICARLMQEEICTSGADYANDSWHYVVHTFGGNQGGQKLYVDGVQVAAGSVAAGCCLPRDVRLGFASDGAQHYFDGLIDEVEIYPRALAADEIEERFKEPVFHATFDESQAGNFRDISPYRNDIICYGNRCPTAGRTGVIGKGVSFNQKQYLTVQPSGSLNLRRGDGHFTLAAWVYPKDSDGAWHGVFGYENPDYPDGERDYPTLSVGGTRVRARFGNGSQRCEVTSAHGALTLNRWQQIVATFDGVNFALYVNNHQVASDANCAGTKPYGRKSFDIGRASSRATVFFDRVVVREEGDGAGPAEYNGFVDNRRIWALLEVDPGTYDLPYAHTVYGDILHSLMLTEVDSNELGRGDDDLLVYRTFYNTDIGDFSQDYDEDGEGTLYWSVDNDFFTGKLDDLRIYNYGFDADDVADLYARTSRSLEIRFDEPPGADIFRDYSGGDSDGVCSGDHCPVTGLAGRSNQTARFEGDDYVVVTNVDVSETAYGLSLWFKTTCSNCGIFSAYDADDANAHDRDLYLQGGNVCARLLNRSAICTSGANYDDDRWHHVAYTFGPAIGGEKLYLDGQEQATGGGTSSDFTAQTGVKIGLAPAAANDYFSGYIDQVTILRYALTAADVDELAAGMPVLNLHLDEPLDATDFRNEANLGNAGFCSGAACPRTGVKGWMRRAPVFDGIDDLISVTDNGLDLSRFTISMWVKPRQRMEHSQVLIRKGANSFNTGHLGLTIWPNTMQVGLTALNSSCETLDLLLDAQDPLIQDQWNHIAATYDGQRMTLYINGTPSGSAPASSARCQNSEPVRIGRDVAGEYPFNGQIDELTIYGRALSRNEVQELYDYQVTWYDSSFSHDITIDADDPSATIVFSPTVVDMSAGRVIAIAAQDDTSDVELVEYRINGGAWQAANRDEQAWIISFTPAAEGDYTIEARAADSVGHLSAVDTVSFRVDGSAPVVAVDSASTQQTLPAVQSTVVVTTTAQTGFPTRDDDTNIPAGYCWQNAGDYVQGTRKLLDAPFVNRVALELPLLSFLDAGVEADFDLAINGTVVGSFTVSADDFPWDTKSSRLVSFSFPPIWGPVYDLRLEMTNALAPLYSSLCIQHWMPPGTVTLFSPREKPAWTVDLAGTVYDVGGGGTDGVDVQLLDLAGRPSNDAPQPATLNGTRWRLAYPLPARSNGQYTLRLTAEDSVGNTVVRADETIGVDGTPPVADVTRTGGGPRALAGVGSRATITGTAGDIPYPAGRRLHLHFEEDTGAAIFYDGSGRQMNGACSGDNCPAAAEIGRWGRALRFDGHDDYILVADAVVTTTGSTPYTTPVFAPRDYTVLAWFQTTGAPISQTIFAATDPTDPAYGLWLAVESGGQVRYTYRPPTGDARLLRSGATYADGRWHHLAAVKSGPALALYLDGQNVVTATASADFDGSLDIAIGRLGRTLAAAYFDGLIDEVALYERALTAEQIQALARPAASGVEKVELRLRHARAAALSNGLVMHMPFDEEAGATTFSDDGPTLSHAVCQGAACPTAGGAGQSGQALDFDGLDDHVRRGIFDSGGQPVRTLTLAAWVKPDSITGTRRILTYGDLTPPSDPYYIARHREVYLGTGGGFYWIDYRGLDFLGFAAAPIPSEDVGQWVHLAGVYDGAWWRLYRNGQLKHTVLASATLDVEGETWAIGADLSGDDHFFDGMIDEPVIYNRALSADEIAVLADATNPLRWREATLDQPGASFSTWRYQVPEGIEGPHQIDLRVTDQFGQVNLIPSVWSGEIDTWPPRIRLYSSTPSTTSLPYYYVTLSATDYNLTARNMRCPVYVPPPYPADYCVRPVYQNADWYTAVFSQTKLYRYRPAFSVGISKEGPYFAQVCDLFDQCTTATELTFPSSHRSNAVQTASDRSLAAPARATATALETAILTPTQHTVFTSTAPITIETYAYALDYLRRLTVTVDGAPLSATSWASNTATETLWTTTYTPTAEGRYTLAALVSDWGGNAITEPTSVVTIYVDTAPPTVTITTDRITGDDFSSAGYVSLRGIVSDTVGIEHLWVRLNDRGWEECAVPTATHAFSASVWSGSQTPPAGETFTITARAGDVAGRITEISRTVWADAAPPAPVTLTLTYSDGLGARTVVTPGTTIRDVPSPTLFINWTASGSGDVARYLAGWTVTPTLAAGDLAALSAYAPAGREHAQSAGETQRLYGHLVIEDTSGNHTVQTVGPIYTDYGGTPAYIPLDDGGQVSNLPYYTGWLEDECNLLGVDRRGAQTGLGGAALNVAQKLYLTWDDAALRLAWSGADWAKDGDLFIYLDTQPGGTSTAYNPYTVATDTLIYLPGVTPTVQLPLDTRSGAPAPLMEADYLVWVEDATTARLWRWDGGDWITATAPFTAQYRFEPTLYDGLTDLYLPFDQIGIANPPSATLGLVAFASAEDALDLWAVLPAPNPVNGERVVATAHYAGAEQRFALSRRYRWTGLGAGICPNAAYPDGDGRASVTVTPDGVVYSFLGDGLFWLWETMFGNPPADVSRRLSFVDAGHLPLSDGQTVSYTIRYRNQGDDTAHGVWVDISAHYALRLPGADPAHHTLWLGDVAPGATVSQTFQAEVNVTEAYQNCIGTLMLTDCSPYLQWAALDALVYDGAHPSAGPPVEWLWVDHAVDSVPPEFFGLRQPEHLLKASVNPLRGYAYDAAGVSTMNLEIRAPTGTTTTLVCPDATPRDGEWACNWDMSGASDGDQFGLRLQGVDVFGRASDLAQEPTITFTVDSLPPTLTLSLEEGQATTYTLVVRESNYRLSGYLSDERGLGSVSVCEAGTCAEAEMHLDAGPGRIYYEDVPVTPLPLGGATACITRTFSVTESFALGAVRVGINVTHTLRDDVRAELESPAGTLVRIIESGQNASGAPRNYDVLLDDAVEGVLSGERDDHPSVPYYDRSARPYQPLRAFLGENVAGDWTLTVCDDVSAQNDGLYNRSRLEFKPQNTASRTGQWTYRASAETEEQDYVEHNLAIYGRDLVGNSTAPLTLTLAVDNVAPVITVTTPPPAALTPGDALHIAGLVSDGGGVRVMRLNLLLPGGETVAALLAMDPPTRTGRLSATWIYTDTSRFLSYGPYIVWLEALDEAGNQSAAGPFELTVGRRQVYLPLVCKNYEPERERVYLPLVLRNH